MDAPNQEMTMKLDQDMRNSLTISRRFLAVSMAIATCVALWSIPSAQAQGAQPAPAQQPRPAARRDAPKPGTGTPLAGFGTNSKEPIKIDANKLEVFDKENKAIFTGDVVAVQGQTTMRCSKMIVIYAQNRDGAARPATAASPAPAAPAAGQNSIKQIDCEGPVSLLSGTQSATSNKLVYEADKDIVTLTGKVVIADCDNVQRGERAVYDVKTGKATVDAGPTGRVQGVFTPGGDDKKAPGAGNAPKTECGPSAKPAVAAPAPTPARPANPQPQGGQQPMRLQPNAPTRG
jgi:lipopolysaccharide export system protein LptA